MLALTQGTVDVAANQWTTDDDSTLAQMLHKGMLKNADGTPMKKDDFRIIHKSAPILNSGILFRMIIPSCRWHWQWWACFRLPWSWNDDPALSSTSNREGSLSALLGHRTMTAHCYWHVNSALAYPYLMAVSTIVALPVIIIFFVAQRTFIEGISTTGLKG